jgi:hypothetical protein
MFESSHKKRKLDSVVETVDEMEEIPVLALPDAEKSLRRSTYRKKKSNNSSHIEQKEKVKQKKHKNEKTKKEKKKNVNKNKNKTKNKNIKPHAGEALASTPMSAKILEEISGLDADKLLSLLETMASSAMFQNSESRVFQLLLVGLEYGKLTVGSSACKFAYDYIKKHSEDFKIFEKWTLTEAIDFMRTSLLDWENMKNNKGIQAIFDLMTYVVTLGFLEGENISLSFGQFDVMKITAQNERVHAKDVIDAIWKSVIFAAEAVKGIMSGNYRSCIHFDTDVTKFEEAVFQLKREFEYVVTGSYDKMETSRAEFEKLLDDTIFLGKRLSKINKGQQQSRILLYLRDLEAMLTKHTQTKVSGDLRTSPYSYVIFGSSSVGKSTLGSFVMRYLLEVNGFRHSSEFLATVNPSDRFFSNFKNYIEGIFMDDFANMLEKFCAASPCQTLLELVNNIPMYLVQAEVELKGRIVATPKVVGLTTNVADLAAYAFSREPASIVRRMEDHIHIKVKPEFRKREEDGTLRVELDTELVKLKYPDWGNDKSDFAIIPDVWEIKIYKCVICAKDKESKTSKQKSSKQKGDPWKFEFAQFEGKKMDNIDLKTLQRYLRVNSAKHFDSQTRVVSNDKKMNKNHVCQTCKYHHSSCECESPNIVPNSAQMPDSLQRFNSNTWVKYLNNTHKTAFRTDFQGFVESLVWEGTIKSSALRTALENHTSHAMIAVLERLREVGRLYIRKYHMDDISIWLPHWSEDSWIGTYVNNVYRRKMLRAIAIGNHIGTALKLGVGVVVPFYYFTLPVASLMCAASTYALPENVCSRVVLYTAKHCKLDPERPIRSVAQFAYNKWCDDVIYPYVTFPLMRYDMDFYLRWRKFRNMFKRYVNDMTEQFQRPRVKIGSFILAALLFPQLSAACVLGYTLHKAYMNVMNGNDHADEALRHTWTNIKGVYPSVIRDMVIPSAVTSYMTYVGIPHLYDTIVNASANTMIKQQSTLNPTPAEIRELDAQTSSQMFKPKFEDRIKDAVPVQVSRRSGEVANLIARNLMHVRRGSHVTNGLMLKSGFILLPHHFMVNETTKYKFTRKANVSGKCGNATFECLISSVDFVRVANHDLVVAYLYNSGDAKDILSTFVDRTPMVERTGHMFYRNRDGVLEIKPVTGIRSCTTTNNHVINGKRVDFRGLQYIAEGNCDGMCLSPIVTDDMKSYIAGVHLGGDGVREARGGTPLYGELEAALKTLYAQPHIQNIASEGTLIRKQFGVEILEEKIHERSPLILLEGERNYRVYGSTVGRSQPSSKVMDTPICKTVRNKLDVTKSWCAPRFRGPDKQSPWLPWVTSLKSSTAPSIGFSGAEVARAADDYMVEIAQRINADLSFWKDDVKVLTKPQVVNGIPCTRFVDNMKKSTSVGFPTGGTKEKWLRECEDPLGVYGDYVELHEKYWVQAENMEKEYLSGRRCYPICKSSCKDEPTLSTKEKVRIFQAAQLAFQLLVRKYYLPVCRFLSLNPLLSECAVGVNPHSREWSELATHITKFGKNRVCAIDYKEYDLRMPAQLTFCALKIMQRIAKMCGYSDSDIAIMQGIATDICWPMCAYNGDLIMLLGSNPSGVNVTVYLNGIVNSLLHRLGFFKIYPNERKTFRQCASLITYGDDAAGSVDWWHSGFNMITFRDFLAKHEMTITMAEKDAAFKKFITIGECDFLKRKFVYDKDFGTIVGPLNETSIHKSLCSIMKSKEVSPMEVSAMNLCGAADEYFFHGKSVFEDRIGKLREIAYEHDIGHATKALQLSFTDRLEIWKKQNPE